MIKKLPGTFSCLSETLSGLQVVFSLHPFISAVHQFITVILFSEVAYLPVKQINIPTTFIQHSALSTFSPE